MLGLTLLGTAGPAAAHGDEVVLEVVEATPSDEGSSVTYRVALTYENDGDGINGATVTATAFLAGGDAAAPQVLTGTGADGLYEGTVAFSAPGRWRVQFDAADPEAQTSASYRVAAPAPAHDERRPRDHPAAPDHCGGRAEPDRGRHRDRERRSPRRPARRPRRGRPGVRRRCRLRRPPSPVTGPHLTLRPMTCSVMTRPTLDGARSGDGADRPARHHAVQSGPGHDLPVRRRRRGPGRPGLGRVPEPRWVGRCTAGPS